MRDPGKILQETTLYPASSALYPALNAGLYKFTNSLTKSKLRKKENSNGQIEE